MKPLDFNNGNQYGWDKEIAGVFHMQAVPSAGQSGLA